MTSQSTSPSDSVSVPEFPVAGFHGDAGTDLNLIFAEDVLPVGVYANGAVAWSNPHDLVIDFFVGPMSPNDPQVTVVARMRLSPAVAQDLISVLTRQIEKSKQQLGDHE